MNVQDIINIHPVPWRHIVVGHGDIRMMDGHGQQVQLFTMLEFVQEVTANAALDLQQRAAAAEAAAKAQADNPVQEQPTEASL